MRLSNFGKVIKSLNPTLTYTDILDICLYFRNVNDDNFAVISSGGASKIPPRIDIRKHKSALEDSPTQVQKHVHTFTYNDKTIDIVFYYTVTTNAITFTLDTANNMNALKHCIYIVIENVNKKTYANIKNISLYDNCKINYNNITGTFLFRVAIDLIKSLKPKYDIIGIQLLDNSYITCPKHGESSEHNNIHLSMMSTLLYGTTWYGKYKFEPGEYGKRDKHDIDNFNNNKTIMANTLTRDVPLYKLIKDNNDITSEQAKVLKKVIYDNSDMPLSKFLIKLLNNYDANCVIFRNMYKQLYNLLKLEKFVGYKFYRKI